MNTHETDPQSQTSTTPDERKTRELCGAEHDSLRCMRPKGHDHEHEAFTAAKSITWK